MKLLPLQRTEDMRTFANRECAEYFSNGYEHFDNGAASFCFEVEELLELPDDAGVSYALDKIMQFPGNLHRENLKFNIAMYGPYVEGFDQRDSRMPLVVNRRFESDRDRKWLSKAPNDLIDTDIELLQHGFLRQMTTERLAEILGMTTKEPSTS